MGESMSPREDDEDLPPPSKKRRAARSSRVYLHPDCGGGTEVSGYDFYRVADPFEFVSSTYCASCSRYVGLGSVQWEGRKDSIRAWRRKMRAKAPLSLKLFRWVIAPAVCGFLGLLIGLVAADEKGKALGAVIGLVIGALFGAWLLLAPVSWLIWKDFFRRARGGD